MAYLEYRPSSTLYHYCAPGSFDGITQNSSIWLSDLQHANDPKELQLANVIDNVMREMIARSDSIEERAAYARVKVDLENMRKRFGMHSFSLSLKADQLPMWQEYTDRGRGYCIGFRPSAFNDMPLRIQRVVYVSEDYFSALHAPISAAVLPIVGKHEQFIERIEPVTRLLALITAVKNDSWERESEIRLMFADMAKEKTGIPIGFLRDGTELHSQPPQYRVRDGMDVGYFNKPFGKYRSGSWDASGSICEVILGPNNAESETHLREQLLSLGYKGVTLSRSKCAFRP